MSIQTPVARKREKPAVQGKAPREPAGARERNLAACGIAGLVWFVAAWIVAGLLYPGYSQLAQATSELTSRGAPSAAAAVANLGLIGLGHLFFPMDPAAGAACWQIVMHNVMFVADSVTMIPALLLLSVAFARDPRLRPYRWYTLLTPFLMGLASLDIGLFPSGVPERLSSLVLLLWIEVVALRLLRLALQQPAFAKRDGVKS